MPHRAKSGRSILRRKRSRKIKESAMRKDHLKGMKIVYEDRDILVVDKPPHLLTMASNTEKEKTAYHILTDYVRKGYAKSPRRIFIVHRLDRDTSGIVIFAKDERTKNILQEQWDKTEKKYLAVVYGQFPQKTGAITSYLAENAAHVVYSTHDRSAGKLSTTIYKTLKETKGLSLLEVDLATGRKNQIRVHFAENGHPIVGDQKYGGAPRLYSRGPFSCQASAVGRNPARPVLRDWVRGKKDTLHKRMALHAYSISFLHPWNGRRMMLKTAVPAYFTDLVGNIIL